YSILEDRLREVAFLNKGLTITLHDERTKKEEVFKYDGGLAEFVKYVNRTEDVLHQPIVLEKVVDVEKENEGKTVIDKVTVELALQYTKSEEERVRCYTNNAFNSQGGTHLTGLRVGLTRALSAYGNKVDAFKNVTPTGED